MHTCVLCSAIQYSLTSAFPPQAARQCAKTDEWSSFQYYASLVRCCHINMTVAQSILTYSAHVFCPQEQQLASSLAPRTSHLTPLCSLWRAFRCEISNTACCLTACTQTALWEPRRPSIHPCQCSGQHEATK